MKKWLLVLTMLFSQVAFGKWEAYVPAKLADGVAIASHAGHGGFVVFKQDYAFIAKVVYTGEIRPASVAGSQVLSGFLGVDRDYPVQNMKYGNEVKVTEEGREYWMPVSFDVLTDMQKKLKKGEAFTAY
ncbi:MAG: hypothetical protein ACYCZR_05620, partial [Burkholderiales bacterium]